MKEFFYHFFKWPAFAFWAAVITGASGDLSGVIIYHITKGGIPTYADLVNASTAFSVYRAFVFLSIPFISTVCYRSYKFLKQTIKTSSKRDSPVIKNIFYGFIATCIVLPVSLFFFITTKVKIFAVFYLVSFIAFQVITDVIYAICTDSMIKVSWTVNLVCGILLGIGQFTNFVLFFSKSNKFFRQINALTTHLCIFISYFKLIFDGVLVLGARFIDVDIELFKKEKQNIIDENYGLV